MYQLGEHGQREVSVGFRWDCKEDRKPGFDRFDTCVQAFQLLEVRAIDDNGHWRQGDFIDREFCAVEVGKHHLCQRLALPLVLD